MHDESGRPPETDANGSASATPGIQPRDVALVGLDWNRREETPACLESLGKADTDGAAMRFIRQHTNLRQKLFFAYSALRRRLGFVKIRPRDVAVVVLNWNRLEETLACLESLEKADTDGAAIIVVDNGSEDGSVAAIRERFPDVRVIALAENHGFAGGNNQGIRAALADGAKAVFLLNNDTVVAPDFLGPLLSTANSFEAVAAVSSVTMRMDQPELLDAAFLSVYFGHGIVWHYGVNAMPGEGFDQAREIEAGIGSAMLLLADALDEIGLLDESYFAYHEEVEWCFRARKAGFHIWYQPLSRVWHHGSRSTDIRRPPRPVIVDDSDRAKLPNPVPLSWSPVRSYLGARNSVRFIRQHANLRQKLFFAYSTLRAVPLEFLAAAMGREEEYDIGAWNYRRVFTFYCLERRGIRLDEIPGLLGKVRAVLGVLPRLPGDLLLSLPRHLRAAHRDGHLAHPIEQARGLLDGLRNRPLPLRRLGLVKIRPRDVAVVVLNWNRREETLACLESLEKADTDGAAIIVVDNGSEDGSVAAIRERFPDVRVIALAENRGFAGGNNQGIRAALADGAKAVFLLNNDTVVAPDFLGPLLSTANSFEAVAAVSSVTMRMDQPELLDAAFLSVYFGHGIVWHYGVNAMPGEGFDQAREIEAGIGSAMLLLADALDEIGLLDESYFAYHEEVEWCFRARKAGFHIWYQPLSRVWHHGSRSTDIRRPPRPVIVDDSDRAKLPNPVPLSWSPVRSYLGARNSVRFIRQHANLRQKLFFAYSTLRAVPLEFLAAAMGREEEYDIGAWNYRRVFTFYCLERRGIRLDEIPGLLGKVRAVLGVLPRLPGDLLWSLPRHLRAAHREGHLAHPIEQARGLLDGLRNRPLPLRRLGLRGDDRRGGGGW
jgi:GT2 family glycosyltransferase